MSRFPRHHCVDSEKLYIMGDSDDSSDTEHCGLREPPLVKKLRIILDQYPNNGQIIKELVQNAEDAGAHKMKILYDRRHVKHDTNKKKYNKFFQGPALCFHNDAVFTAEDWEGISMIHSSVKEEDPLKVGRFGLGFKSVFHLTDYPCIISGQKIMFMDPHEREHRVCSTKRLKTLKESKRLDTECVLTALNQIFGFTEQTLETGHYQGTLFRFPLRTVATDLSKSVYNGMEIENLLESFKTEAVSVLIFLSHLENIEIFQKRDGSQSFHQMYSIRIKDSSVHDVRSKNEKFLSEIEGTGGGILANSLNCITKLEIQTSDFGTGTVIEKQHGWMVVKYFKGGTMSEKLKTLIKDKGLSYSPYVGVAASLNTDAADFRGHVYCFLPLPIPEDHQSDSMTQLPVHVNGFFALSQNRAQLKWPTADQMVDKASEWNKCLLIEVLPEAYDILLRHLIDQCRESKYSRVWVDSIYRCIPNILNVSDKWKLMVDTFVPKLIQHDFIFTESDGGRLIKPQDAVFASFKDVTVSTDIQGTVTRTLKQYNINFAEVPAHIVMLLQNKRLFEEITPVKFSQILRRNPALYGSFSSFEKMNILKYLLCSDNYENVQGLALLPLVNGSFAIFSRTSSPVYLVTSQEKALFSGLEGKLTCMDVLTDSLGSKLSNIQRQGLYQLQTLNVNSTVRLFEETIRYKLGTCRPVQVNSSSTITWMSNVWRYILPKYQRSLEYFQSLPLVPVGNNRYWTVYCLTDFMIMQQYDGNSLPEAVCRALESMNVIVIRSLPSWFPSEDIRRCNYLHTPSSSSVLQLLGKLPATYTEQFNRNCRETDRTEFVKFLGNLDSFYNANQSAKQFLRKLQMFRKKSSSWGTSAFVSLQQLNRMLEVEQCPIPYPQAFLVNSSQQERKLAVNLGAELVLKHVVVEQILKAFQSVYHPYQYSDDEKVTFMKEFIPTLYSFEKYQNILRMARSVRFIRAGGKAQAASDLFDPTEYGVRELFVEESVFPDDVEFHQEPLLSGLKKLGLRNLQNLEANDVLHVASKLDEMSKLGRTDATTVKNAKAFMKVLEKNPRHFNSLRASDLENLQCILPNRERDRGYPPVLPWFTTPTLLCTPKDVRSVTFAHLIGSEQSVVNTFEFPNISKQFGWNNKPNVDTVLSHFKNVIGCFDSSRKPQLLGVLAQIYADLSSRIINEVRSGIERTFLTEVENARIILCEQNFVPPKQLFTEETSLMIDFAPYLFKIPEEFLEFNTLFSQLGCHRSVTSHVLLSVLDKVQEKHSASDQTISVVRKDLTMVVSILNHIRDNIKAFEDDNVLVPIHTGDVNRLVLRHAHDCTYCDAQWLKELDDEENEEEFVYVHENVSNQTAEALGVRSLKQHLLSDAEAFEEWGQHEPLTNRLKNLLKEGYVDGLSVPKELFQNADDAGASEMRFLYDERENLDARTKLLDDRMAECQGPALWAFNNARFTEKDLVNIQKLNAATKQDDTSKIGKFGLGFCAVYNLTDVPSFVSGDNIVIFDPHMTFLGKALPGNRPGLKVNFSKVKNRTMVKRMKNQFKPFQSVFGCNIDNATTFNGTLFRFPLRTPSQADKSEIKNLAYTRTECIELLEMFIKSAGNLLLFSQHVTSVKLYHLPSNATSPADKQLVYTATKSSLCLSPSRSFSVGMLQNASELKNCDSLHQTPLQETEMVTVNVKVENDGCLSNTAVESSTLWLLSWATGITDLALQMVANNDGIVPLGCTAIMIKEIDGELTPAALSSSPFGFYKQGHVFAFLPLPIRTSLDVHINGCFAVSSDRRRLLTQTEDDRHRGESWNKSLMEDAICRSYLFLLQGLHEQELKLSRQYVYHAFWPVELETDFLALEQSFYKTIGWFPEQFKVFEKNGQWYSVSQCIFLPDEIIQNESVGQIAFDFLTFFQTELNAVLIDLPHNKVLQFKNSDSDCIRKRTMSVEDYILAKFLPKLQSEYWKDDNVHHRDQLILFAIELGGSHINEALKNTNCIPTQPTGRLRSPQELVHPTSAISELFSVEDERFPKGQLFQGEYILEKLVALGMMKNDIPQDVLLDCTKSVATLAQMCTLCAVERCKNCISYLNRKGFSNVDVEYMHALQNTEFLPALRKPREWVFPWGADHITGQPHDDGAKNGCKKHKHQEELRLAKPKDMYSQRWRNLVSCSAVILDESRLAVRVHHNYSGVYQSLGVNGVDTEVDTEMVLQQLDMFMETALKIEKFNDELFVQEAFHKLYYHLDKQCSKFNEQELPLSEIRSKRILFVNGMLISPTQMAKKLKHDCCPDLFRPGQVLSSYGFFLKRLHVKEFFDPSIIVELLEQKKKDFQMQELSAENIKHICRLILVLIDCMEAKNIEFKDLKVDGMDAVYAPDVKGVLRRTVDMCFEDSSQIKGSSQMHFIHPSIAETTARRLGVITKTRRSLKDNSVKISFGQKERLVTRLQGLLKDYPCDSGILKELIQNADDAKATEIHFIKDYRTHSCDKILDESFAPLQGPALCVFNNSSFTQQDLQGIQNLGIGSKAEDSTKTGQFGIGFNAVYNLTNAPSFLTKGPGIEHEETLCFFDPMCKYIPDIEESDPGVRYIELDQLRSGHGDIFHGYLEDELFPDGRNKGTVFRFPLRTEPCELSHNVRTPDELDGLFAEFQKEMFNMLLFVKYVTKVTVSNITSGHLEEEYSIEVSISEENQVKRDQFQNNRREFAREADKNRLSVFERQCSRTSYDLTVKDSRGESCIWHVSQQIGFKHTDTVPDGVKKAYENKDIGLLPEGGVAVLLSGNDIHAGKAFCYLPLPINTGLPVQVNGHFALDHARRSLWEDEGYRTAWNKCVLKSVVAPAYICALKFCMLHIFGTKSLEMMLPKDVHRKVESFEKFFPVHEEGVPLYWICLSKFVYHTIVDEEERLFPILHYPRNVEDNQETKLNTYEKSCVSVSWTALQQQGHTFPAYFVHGELKELIETLQRLGMKLIVTSVKIQSSIKKSDIEAISLSPKYVINFLKSHNTSAIDKCSVDLGKPLVETVFRSIKNVKWVANYCFSGEGGSDREIFYGMPILVTNDSLLREIEKMDPPFLTQFSCLLPASASRFVHECLVSTMKLMPDAMKTFRSFTLQDLVQLLPYSVDRAVYGRGTNLDWDPDGCEIPNRVWLGKFWEFVWSLSQGKLEIFKESLELIEQLNLVPSRQKKLHPVSQLYTFIDKYLFQSGSSLGLAMEKLELPELETKSLYDKSEFRIALKESIASASKPVELLNCLNFHKELIPTKSISLIESCSILHYFSDNLECLRASCEEWWIQDKLKGLPLFVTQQSTVVSIPSDAIVFVLPADIPCCGIEKWASSTGRLLLKCDINLSKVHEFLQFTVTDSCNFYTNNLGTLVQALEMADFVKHLEYIKDRVLHVSYGCKFSSDQKQLISVLRETPLLQIGETRKRCSELKSPYNKVFHLMCPVDAFPPEYFKMEIWLDFFKHIGLQTRVTGTMYLEFAKQIEEEEMLKGLSPEVRLKSTALVNSLVLETSESISEDCLRQLANIHFVLPVAVERTHQDLFCQPGNAMSLIRYNGSVPIYAGSFCWTTVDLLPQDAIPGFIDGNNLGIVPLPSINQVIKHCQNIGDSLKSKLPGMKEGRKSLHWIRGLFDKIYCHLQKNVKDSKMLKKCLFHTPFVYFSDMQDILPAYKTIMNCSNRQEIAPYLRKVDNYFARYNTMFRMLGAADEPLLKHYIQVLCDVKRQTKENELIPSEFEIVQKAIHNLLSFLRHNECRVEDQSPEILFLPDTRLHLMDAKTLVVPDNPYLQTRIAADATMNYLIDFEELEIPVHEHTLDDLKNLPTQYRPSFLTEIVGEEIDMSGMKKTRNQKSVMLEEFIHSAEFLCGIMRLLKAFFRKDISDNEEKIVAEQFLRVHAWEVTGLKTFLTINQSNGQRVKIPSSEEDKDCFVDERIPDGSVAVYFSAQESDNGHKWTKTTEIELTLFILRATEHRLKYQHVNMLFEYIEYPEKINDALDKLNIARYTPSTEVTRAIFPAVGTYVPLKFHPYLDNKMSLFETHEYRAIAMELDDPGMEDPDSAADMLPSDPTYIYVHIINKPDADLNMPFMFHTYLVYIGGEDFIEVPAYKLYRFLRKRNNIQDVNVSDNAPVPSTSSSQPFEAVFQQIRRCLQDCWTRSESERRRIIKRLYLQWHPDKNLDRREFCETVFKYLKQCIAQLEEGLSLEDEVQDDVDGTRERRQPDFSSTQYGFFFSRMDERSRSHQQQYQQFQQQHQYAGNLNHRESANTPYPRPREAIRWQRQAQADLRDAITCMEHQPQPAYNWVCYRCHQAAEKALKAAWFYKNANQLTNQRHSHRLEQIAAGLGDRLVDLASRLSGITGEHTRMRYPDSLAGEVIPADSFTREMAEQVIEIATQLLNAVSENYA